MLLKGLHSICQQIWKTQSERGQLYAAHKDADPRMVGIRILMVLTPDYLRYYRRLVTSDMSDSL